MEVRRIVDLHGGKLQVGSRAGEGTRFTVLFPLQQAPGRETTETI